MVLSEMARFDLPYTLLEGTVLWPSKCVEDTRKTSSSLEKMKANNHHRPFGSVYFSFTFVKIIEHYIYCLTCPGTPFQLRKRVMSGKIDDLDYL